MKTLIATTMLMAAVVLPRGASAQDAALSPALACIAVAQDQTLIDEGDAEKLCEGSPSANGPVDCYALGQDETTLSNVQLIELCRCAVDVTPVQCFTRGLEITDMFDGRVIDECRPIRVQRLRFDCTPLER